MRIAVGCGRFAPIRTPPFSSCLCARIFEKMESLCRHAPCPSEKEGVFGLQGLLIGKGQGAIQANTQAGAFSSTIGWLHLVLVHCAESALRDGHGSFLFRNE